MNTAAPLTENSISESGGAASSAETKSLSFFLDTFPTGVLDNVLKFFSNCPKVKHWTPHIPLESIIELYGVKGELGELMKTRFNTLCVSVSFRSARKNMRYGWKLREDTLWTNDVEVARRFLLAGGGQSLHTLIVGRFISIQKYGTAMADRFLSNCPNLKSLTIHDIRGVWVSMFGSQLEELEIEIENPSIISRHCPSLRALTLSNRRNVVADRDFWSNIGTRLESLTLGSINSEGGELESITTHCRNLRRISININQESNQNDKLANLLASYGDKLEYCHIENMNESQLATITSACTNAGFSAMISEYDLIYPTVKVLGSQLEKCIFRCPPADEIPAEMTKAWNECANIRELEVFNCNIEHVSAMTGKRKVLLKDLSIGVRANLEENEVKNIMDIFSTGTVGVESLTYRGPLPAGNAFDKFMATNRSSLREVSLTFVEGNSNEAIDAYLPLLLKCPALGTVHGNRFSRITFETLRSRGIRCCDVLGRTLYAD